MTTNRNTIQIPGMGFYEYDPAFYETRMTGAKPAMLAEVLDRAVPDLADLRSYRRLTKVQLAAMLADWDTASAANAAAAAAVPAPAVGSSPARNEVASGNGLAIGELPKFHRHIHPETGSDIHKGWADCALSSCTWAGMTPAERAKHATIGTAMRRQSDAIEQLAAAAPAKERRNETRHPDGAAAVEFAACPQCKARKGEQCIRHDGERTPYVHAKRMAKWDQS